MSLAANCASMAFSLYLGNCPFWEYRIDLSRSSRKPSADISGSTCVSSDNEHNLSVIFIVLFSGEGFAPENVTRVTCVSEYAAYEFDICIKITYLLAFHKIIGFLKVRECSGDRQSHSQVKACSLSAFVRLQVNFF